MLVVETARLLLRQPQEADAGSFVNIHQDHIISLIRPDNPSSIRVALKIGERFGALA